MGRRHRTTRDQSPHPEEKELDISAFSEALNPNGLQIRDVANDGNCFFRAVSDQLYGFESEHMKLRQLACDYLDENRDHYKHFIDEEQSFDEYVSDMRTDGVWADNLELQAISMVCIVNIRVHQSKKPSYDIRNHTAKNARAIHLSYHFGEHYASVRPLHTADIEVPAQHEPLPNSRRSKPPHDNDGTNADDHPNYCLRNDDDYTSAVWNHVDRTHYDLCDLTDTTRRAAKTVRSIDSSTKEVNEAKYLATNVERDMKAVEKKLHVIRDTIVSARSAHRHRTLKLQRQRLSQQPVSSTSSESDNVSTQLDEASEDEKQYHSCIRQEADTIMETLDNIAASVRNSLRVVNGLEQQYSKSSQGKPSRGSKKKEQESKKKDRKERRRRAQEKQTRTDRENPPPVKLLLPHELDITI